MLPRHELNYLNEVEINPGDIISSKELLFSEECDNLLKFSSLYNFLLDGFNISLPPVAWLGNCILELVLDITQHVGMGFSFSILSAEFRVPFFSDVIVDWNCLGHLELTINEIWEIWKLHTQGVFN